jgi:hypothetical protein
LTPSNCAQEPSGSDQQRVWTSSRSRAEQEPCGPRRVLLHIWRGRAHPPACRFRIHKLPRPTSSPTAPACARAHAWGCRSCPPRQATPTYDVQNLRRPLSLPRGPPPLTRARWSRDPSSHSSRPTPRPRNNQRPEAQQSLRAALKTVCTGSSHTSVSRAQRGEPRRAENHPRGRQTGVARPPRTRAAGQRRPGRPRTRATRGGRAPRAPPHSTCGRACTTAKRPPAQTPSTSCGAPPKAPCTAPPTSTRPSISFCLNEGSHSSGSEAASMSCSVRGTAGML